MENGKGDNEDIKIRGEGRVGRRRARLPVDDLPPPEVPPVKVIPFRLNELDDDDDDDGSKSEPKTMPDHTAPVDLNFAGILELPLVHNTLKGDRFYIRGKAVTKRKPRIVSTNPLDKIALHLSEMNLQEVVDIQLSKNNKNKPTTLHLDMVRNEFLDKASKYEVGGKVSVTDHVHGMVEVKREQTKTSPKDKKSEVDNEDLERTSGEILNKLYYWLIGIKETEENQHLHERWNKLRSHSATDRPTINSIAELIQEKAERIINLDLFRGDKYKYIVPKIRKGITCHAIYPDILKMMAFTFWQKGDTKRCAQFLNAAHGTFLRTDINDKILLNLMRIEEGGSTAQLQNKDLVNSYTKHLQELDNFCESSSTQLQNKMNEINPEWNVVQVTTMFHYHNRFSSDVVAALETQSLFLTCFSSLYGEKERASFTTFIPEPLKNPAITSLTLTEEFTELLLQNRKINGKNQDRRCYWETRTQHNQQLTSIMAAVEENWLFPWTFMLGGSLVDKALQTKINDTIISVEIALQKELNSSQKLALTKLIENFNILSSPMKNAVGHLVAFILDDFLVPIARIANEIMQIGSSIPLRSSRNPTIFILDQEIEQFPWEWLACMRQNSATRIQSMAVLYSTMKLLKMRPSVDPKLCSFILNPDGSLVNVEKRLEPYFKSRSTWDGIMGATPCYKEVEKMLVERSIYLYCGHGNGQSYFPEHALQKIVCNAVPLLMGCASAQYRFNGPKTYSSSVLNAYTIALCTSVVGFLWEVTDVECDRVTVELLERWAPGPVGTKLPVMGNFDTSTNRSKIKGLASAIKIARRAATQFLTEAAIVNYGLPVFAKHDNN